MTIDERRSARQSLPDLDQIPTETPTDPVPNALHGISSGDTTTDATTLWARSDTSGEVRFELATRPSFKSLAAFGSDVVVDVWRPAKVRLDGLAAGNHRRSDSGDAAWIPLNLQ